MGQNQGCAACRRSGPEEPVGEWCQDFPPAIDLDVLCEDRVVHWDAVASRKEETVPNRQGVDPEGPDPQAPSTCRLRIIAVSDVYLLDNLPALKSLVEAESRGIPRENLVTVLPGDFLAPSLLSSLDAGHSMVKALNAVPVDLVCFGNHDGNDVAYTKLVHRIEEFKGQWLNSNIPDFEPQLPESCVRSLLGEDGRPGARTVAFLGFCIGGGRFKAMYREDAFGGAHRTIVPILEAAPLAYAACRDANPMIDEIIPLTHQDLAEDVELAKTGMFPVIIAGHDHDLTLQNHGDRDCPVVKPGMDATHAAIVDVRWYSDERGEVPRVTCTFRAVSDYPADPELADVVERAQRPVVELEAATLFELSPGDVLTSVDARRGDVSMAVMLATSVRECLNSKAAVINSGTVRGNREYRDIISYGDLKRECPFESAVVVVEMPFSVFREAVKRSRKPWWEGDTPKESASALQVDAGVEIGPDHAPTTIWYEAPFESDEFLYTVACDTYVLKKNEVFREYCEQHPERIPPADCGRPLLPILVEHFCTEMWRRIIEKACGEVLTQAGLAAFRRDAGRKRLSSMAPECSTVIRFGQAISKLFRFLDANRDGFIDVGDLQEAVKRLISPRLSSALVVEQLVHMADGDADGMLSESDFRSAVRKLAPRDCEE